MSTTIEQSLKQIIAAAIHEVKSKTYERAEDVDPVEAFIEDLFAVLFPTQQQVQHVTVPTVTVEPEKPKRGRKPKATTAEVPGVPEETQAAPEKPKRGRKPKATPPSTPPTAPDQTEAPPAPKKDKEQAKNIDKLTATNKKHIKKWAEEVGAAEPDTKALLAHVNAMTPEDFNGSTFEQHVKSFLQPAEEPVKKDLQLLEVQFQGKTYYVDEESTQVYEDRGDEHVRVGYVGMAAFADMKL
jgi:hypothetical protein